MNKLQIDVGTFLRRMGHQLPDEPRLMMENDPLAQKRLDLVGEEYEEFLDAIYSGDLAEIGGEGCDLIYSVLAVLEAHGLDMDPFWKRIQDANLKKDPNPDGKPTKGPDWRKPDLVSALVEQTSRRVIKWQPGWVPELRALVEGLHAEGKIGPLDRADFARLIDRHT